MGKGIVSGLDSRRKEVTEKPEVREVKCRTRGLWSWGK